MEGGHVIRKDETIEQIAATPFPDAHVTAYLIETQQEFFLDDDPDDTETDDAG
jgi:hypothetical protein